MEIEANRRELCPPSDYSARHGCPGDVCRCRRPAYREGRIRSLAGMDGTPLGYVDETILGAKG